MNSPVSDDRPYNTSNIEEPIVYTKTLEQPTAITIDVDTDSVQAGEPIIATATVTSDISKEFVQDGMIVFILKNNDKEVYRYGTRIDSVGRIRILLWFIWVSRCSK